MNTTLNPYLELGVTPGVTLQELKQAYRQAVLRYHPDSAIGSGNPLKFHAVTEAYRQLREALDQQRSPSFSPPAPPPRSHERRKAPTQVVYPSVDSPTLQLNLEELINCFLHSDNSHVRSIAVEAIFLKRDSLSTEQLLEWLQPTVPKELLLPLIKASRLAPRSLAFAGLLRVLEHSELEVVSAAIQALEERDLGCRKKILQQLRPAQIRFWDRLRSGWQKNFDPSAVCPRLGEKLLQLQVVRPDQLSIALLLQERFPLLLGQILRKLGYVEAQDLRYALQVIQTQP